MISAIVTNPPQGVAALGLLVMFAVLTRKKTIP